MSTTKEQAQAALKVIDDYFSDEIIISPPPPPDTIGPPYGVTSTLMTIFGLNWDKSIDKGDNGKGAWGANTRDEKLVGIALPILLIKDTFGSTDSSKIKGFTVEVYSQLTQKTVASVDIVDLGPAARLHRLADGTYGLHATLGHIDLFTKTYGADTKRWPAGAHVGYWIIDPDGKTVEIKGVDFAGGRVIGS